ncbi:DegT/DnrJ/EryC1/StrS family aminotransferase [Aureliella helgolandensis]|uniref:Pyridoxal phosphate-dependent aminotransferase EpsN n=1 Tax=Aureliella helgolandensis TaxID=2527968 RepID=A0A518FZG7_9BACT|nr:aminotransferase class I/II-fold pyridoxal phosphate-dependent enzyme [Aureliella helgolandensis]QDV21752.1 Putative pyridoxal phosphate-dependent aminotransferase EpsN [Aureliella helgolandensis]
MSTLFEQIQSSVRDALEELLSNENYRTYDGHHCAQLRNELGQLSGGRDVLLTSSGSAALELALRARGIGAGDRVLLSAYDYPGNFWAIERVGARPVLLDVEPAGWRVDSSAVERAVQDASSPAPKALVASHLHGQLQRMDALRERCDQSGIFLIEDACQAPGADVNGLPAGAQGHASIYSFGGSKVLSAGRGGALLTSDPAMGQRVKLAAGAGSGAYELSEVQAALVLAQLPWLEQINQACRVFFGDLLKSLASTHLIAPWEAMVGRTAFYQAGFLIASCPIGVIENQSLGQKIAQLQARGIPAGNGFAGFHRRSLRRCERIGALTCAADIASRTWTLHHGVALHGKWAAQEVAAHIDQVMSEA